MSETNSSNVIDFAKYKKIKNSKDQPKKPADDLNSIIEYAKKVVAERKLRRKN